MGENEPTMKPKDVTTPVFFPREQNRFNTSDSKSWKSLCGHTKYMLPKIRKKKKKSAAQHCGAHFQSM